MNSVRIVDTSVLCNLLRVPNRDQDRERATREFRTALNDEDVLLLPVPVIYETGNHIAQNGDGRVRRERAEAFVDLVRKAFSGEIPFVPTPLHSSDDMLGWLAEFPDSAGRGVGFSDLSITRVFEQQCALNQSRRVFIWSYDGHLQGYDQPPRI